MDSPLRRLLPRQRRSFPAGSFSPDSKVMQAGVLVTLAQGARSIGVDGARCFDGLSLSEAEMDRFGARVSWNEILRGLHNLEALGLTSSDFERMGPAMAADKHMLIGRFAGVFLRPEYLYYLGLSWIAPSVFPVIQHQFDYRGAEMSLRLAIPDGFGESETFFHVCKGSIASMPTIIGHPPAKIDATITSHCGSYEIVCRRAHASAWSPIRLAKAAVSMPTFFDVLTQQERELRRRLEAAVGLQTQFRRVLDALPEAVLIHRDGVVVYVNPCAIALLGFGAGDKLLGKRIETLVHVEDHDLLDREWQGTEDIRFSRGEERPVLMELSPPQRIVFDELEATLWVGRDVTERRALQDQLAMADRIDSLGVLSAGIAHELNNPLTMVMSHLQLAGRKAARSDGSSIKRHLEGALEGARRVTAIARDLSTFSRAELDEPEEVDVERVVRSAVALCTGKVKERARLELELDPVPVAMANEGRLAQVLLNLIINALEAMPKRRPDENLITVRLRDLDGRVVIEVEDNGSGISSELATRVFEPFFSTKTKGSGSGLGLAVARELVRQFGGELSFASVPDGGTTFRVSLVPGHQPTVRPTRDAKASRATTTAGRILLVDDEPALLEVTSTILEEKAHQITTASTGNQAIAIVGQSPSFDVILCDLMMPEGTGIDVYRHLQKHHPELVDRVVFITGGTVSEESRSFLGSVPNPCLFKPFDLEELCRIVADTIRHDSL